MFLAEKRSPLLGIRSDAPLCPAFCDAAHAAGHHGCTRTCQAPIFVACSRHTRSCGIAWTVLTTVFPITLFSVSCRISHSDGLAPAAHHSAWGRHAAALAATATRPFAW